MEKKKNKKKGGYTLEDMKPAVKVTKENARHFTTKGWKKGLK